MSIDVVMPQMGESIFEGTITKWLKKAGDKVERDEPLFEISTDKVDAEIPAPSAGVLKEIKVAEGQTVPVQTVVAVIDSNGAGAATAAAAPAPAKAEAPKPAKAEESKPEPAKAAPAPRKNCRRFQAIFIIDWKAYTAGCPIHAVSSHEWAIVRSAIRRSVN